MYESNCAVLLLFFGNKEAYKTQLHIEPYDLKQTLKDFEEGRVPIDIHSAIFYRTTGVILLIWTQQDFYRTLGTGQMDG